VTRNHDAAPKRNKLLGQALSKSVGRMPETFDGPAVKVASPIGAALDLLTEHAAGTTGARCGAEAVRIQRPQGRPHRNDCESAPKRDPG
jgi:hypothetical protein